MPTLRGLIAWFHATNTPYIMIGGVAVSLVARPRLTLDVDSVVLIDESALPAFVESGAAFGFTPRITDLVEFAQNTRVLLMQHQPDGTGLTSRWPSCRLKKRPSRTRSR